MIRTGTYEEFADQEIGGVEKGKRIHGGNFGNLLTNSPQNAARLYKVFTDYYGVFATAAEFALQCDWNEPADAYQFVQENPSWPPDSLADELSRLK